MKRSVRIGSGAGWARDRLEPAVALAEHGDIDYLCFDSMSEVTMSAAQVARMERPENEPYDPYLVERMRLILPACHRNKVRIVTNQGWLDPAAAGRKVAEVAAELGIHGMKIAIVDCNDLNAIITDLGVSFIEDGELVSRSRERIVSAEAYLGAAGIIEGLAMGADIVITTRIADGCLYLGPLAHELGWDIDDPSLAARGMIIGHLMECGAQVSGGYFADPGYKFVPGLSDIGNPIVEVTDDRTILTKLSGTGGVVSPATCKEQLLYEVEDPANYICPDCIADLTRVSFEQIGVDRVEVVIDDAGKPRTPYLKALIGLREGFMTEEMVIFAGPGALDRARLTQSILEDRFRTIDLKATALRFDYIGLNAVHREATPASSHDPHEVVLRIALQTAEKAEAEKLRREIDPLAVNGVAGTGKWSTSTPGSRVRPVVGLNSCLIPRDTVKVSVEML